MDTMKYLVEAATLLSPLVAYAIRRDWGVLVLVAPGSYATDDARDAAVVDLVDELDRTGRSRAWRTSAA